VSTTGLAALAASSDSRMELRKPRDGVGRQCSKDLLRILQGTRRNLTQQRHHFLLRELRKRTMGENLDRTAKARSTDEKLGDQGTDKRTGHHVATIPADGKTIAQALANQRGWLW
jgi:hypothetical protein